MNVQFSCRVCFLISNGISIRTKASILASKLGKVSKILIVFWCLTAFWLLIRCRLKICKSPESYFMQVCMPLSIFAIIHAVVTSSQGILLHHKWSYEIWHKHTKTNMTKIYVTYTQIPRILSLTKKKKLLLLHIMKHHHLHTYAHVYTILQV